MKCWRAPTRVCHAPALSPSDLSFSLAFWVGWGRETGVERPRGTDRWAQADEINAKKKEADAEKERQKAKRWALIVTIEGRGKGELREIGVEEGDRRQGRENGAASGQELPCAQAIGEEFFCWEMTKENKPSLQVKRFNVVLTRQESIRIHFKKDILPKCIAHAETKLQTCPRQIYPICVHSVPPNTKVPSGERRQRRGTAVDVVGVVMGDIDDESSNGLSRVRLKRRCNVTRKKLITLESFVRSRSVVWSFTFIHSMRARGGSGYGGEYGGRGGVRQRPASAMVAVAAPVAACGSDEDDETLVAVLSSAACVTIKLSTIITIAVSMQERKLTIYS
uniref:Uncharacterized protein n=1 Tax=Oryza punctata TaxID=4537 RepID=A0A0E0JJ27_ORYPU